MQHLGDYFYLGVSMAALPPRDLFTTWCLVCSQSAGGKDEIRAIQSQQNTSDVRKDLATSTFSKSEGSAGNNHGNITDSYPQITPAVNGGLHWCLRRTVEQTHRGKQEGMCVCERESDSEKTKDA